MACIVVTPLFGVEMAEMGGVSGACKEPDDGVVVVVDDEFPSDVCRDGGAVNPPET